MARPNKGSLDPNGPDWSEAPMVDPGHTHTTASAPGTTGALPLAGGTMTGLFLPEQAITASAPAYVKGAIYFDLTLNKLRVGGATAWESITSA